MVTITSKIYIKNNKIQFSTYYTIHHYYLIVIV